MADVAAKLFVALEKEEKAATIYFLSLCAVLKAHFGHVYSLQQFLLTSIDDKYRFIATKMPTSKQVNYIACHS